ncbi:MAG: hypothetical protein Q9212_005200 [Teloschistes hypoglaucus]
MHRWPGENDPYSVSPGGRMISSKKRKQAEALSPQSSSQESGGDDSSPIFTPAANDASQRYPMGQSGAGQEALPSNVDTAVGSRLSNDIFDLSQAQSNPDGSPITQIAFSDAAIRALKTGVWTDMDAAPVQSQAIAAVPGHGQGFHSQCWAGDNDSTFSPAEPGDTSFVQDPHQSFGRVAELALAYDSGNTNSALHYERGPQTAHDAYYSTADTTSHPNHYPPSTDLGHPAAPQMPRYPVQASPTALLLPGVSDLHDWVNAINDHADHGDSRNFCAPHMQQYPSSSSSTRLPMGDTANRMQQYPSSSSSTRMPMVGTANYRPYTSSSHPGYFSVCNNIGSSYTPQTEEEWALHQSQALSEYERRQQDEPLNLDGPWT